MDDNLKRYKLLKLLSEHHIKVETEKSSEPIGISFDDLQKKLNCSKEELRRISSTLFENNEAEYMDIGVVGMFATEKGFSAYSDNKYKRESNLRLKNNIKDLIQIIVPILSLIIAFLALTFKIDTLNKQNEKSLEIINQELIFQEKQIDSLKNLPKEILKRKSE